MLITADRSGIWSNINKVATAILDQPKVEAAWYAGIFPYGKRVHGNIYALFFNNCCKENGTIRHMNVTPWTTYKFTGHNVASFYKSASKQWRWELNYSWLKMQLKDRWVEYAQIQMATMGLEPGGYDALQIRFGDHAKEQPTGRLPSIREYKQQITGRVPLFLASNIGGIRAHFPEARTLVMPVCDSDSDLMYKKRNTLEDIRDAIVDVLIMSKARRLIHSVSNMATGALYVNPLLESVYLEG